MNYEVVESSNYPGEWRCEAINFEGDGEISVVLFSGPKAKEKAQEYADWQASGGFYWSIIPYEQDGTNTTTGTSLPEGTVIIYG